MLTIAYRFIGQAFLAALTSSHSTKWNVSPRIAGGLSESNAGLFPRKRRQRFHRFPYGCGFRQRNGGSGSSTIAGHQLDR